LAKELNFINFGHNNCLIKACKNPVSRRKWQRAFACDILRP
jgi:hypothetical protein